jgi:stage II sporulation protein E
VKNMPKVTVVTVPAETLPVTKQPSVSTMPKKRIAWRAIFTALRNILAGLTAREHVPLNLLAFLLGRVVIMGELAPFGLALFAAVAQTARERAGAVAFWALTGVLSSGRYAEAFLYIWSILLYYRLADKLTELPRRLVTVPLLLFAAVVSGGLISLLWQQVTLYNILLVLFEAAICTIGSYIFLYGVPSLLGRPASTQVSGEMMICAVVILSAAVAGLGGLNILGYSVRNMTGTLLVMGLAYGGGAGIGAAVGVATGLVIGLTEGNVPVSIALYALSGTLAGVFRSLGKYAVILGYILGGSITVFGFAPSQDIVFILAETSVAAVAFLALPSSWTIFCTAAERNRMETVGSCQGNNTAVAKLENVGEMFHDLAGAFGQITAGTREKIKEAELTRLLAAVGDRVCGQCGRRTECWERDFYKTYQAMLDTLGIAETGDLSQQKLPQPLKSDCVKRGEIIETVSLVAERNRSNLYWQKKVSESRHMIAEQMRAASSIIATLAGEMRKEPYADKGLATLIKDKAGLLGCALEEVEVTGDKEVTAIEVRKAPCMGTRECMNTIMPLTASLLKQKLTLHADCANGSKTRWCKLCMRVANRYTVQTGRASAAKQAGGVNGDTCSVVKLEQGKILMMLSDGMGCGSQAASESAMAVSFLERLMSVGFDVDVAVKTVNSMLLLRMPEESFATVDMAVIDVFSGEAEFLKIGSAPSFLKRVREVTTVRSANLPIGILSQVEIEPIQMLLVPGDMIVMVSDGISEVGQRSVDRENWIANFLRRQSTAHPQEIADRLLQQAIELAGGKVRDDMTVLTAVVVERPELKS